MKDEPQLASQLPADILALLDQPAEVKTIRLVPAKKPANAKLTDDDVRAIRAATGSHAEVAREYGISRGAVGLIRSRRHRGNVI